MKLNRKLPKRFIPLCDANVIVGGAIRDGLELFCEVAAVYNTQVPRDAEWATAGIDTYSGTDTPIYYVDIYSVHHKEKNIYRGARYKDAAQHYIECCGKGNAVKSVLIFFKAQQAKLNKKAYDTSV